MSQQSLVPRNDYEELLALVERLKPDAEKLYYKNNKAAGTRLRKGLMEVKRKVDIMRKKVADITRPPSKGGPQIR